MPQKVIALSMESISRVRSSSNESRSLGVERKWGGNLHPWLNTGERSIANKYPEGKLKSTSKGELKDLKSLRGKRLSVTHMDFGFGWDPLHVITSNINCVLEHALDRHLILGVRYSIRMMT